jgi:cytidine deaminase
LEKKTLNFSYSVFSAVGDLEPELNHLVHAAIKACDNAYAPYSHFRVGAAVLLATGGVIIGSNQENMAYPSGLCAERVALFAARSQFPDVPIKALAIAAQGKQGQLNGPVTPCGGCRQVMAEYEMLQNVNFKVLLAHPGGQVWMLDRATSLLPMAFFARGLGLE